MFIAYLSVLLLKQCFYSKLHLYRVRVRVSGSRGSTHARQYFGWHGICVRIGYRLSSLDMGPCAWRRRLGAILGRGAGTSTIRVRVRVRVFGVIGLASRRILRNRMRTGRTRKLVEITMLAG